MNANLLNIVKCITAEQGEGILGDPQRLKSFIKDYAKDEPKEDRVAFGRCIEQDFYRQIKAAKTADERRRLKADIAKRLQTTAGLSAAQSSGALDILDAAVPLPASSYTPPVSTPWMQNMAGAGAFFGKIAARAKTISRKTLIFGAAGGAGAFAGELVSWIFRDSSLYQTSINRIINVAIWGAFVGLGISVWLFVIQTLSTKRKVDIGFLIKTVLTGLVAGAVSGGFAQFIFNYTQLISPLVKQVTNALCWGVMGTGLGLGASFYVPNYPPKRAALAGAIGGTLGGIIYVALMNVSFLGGIIGIVVLGAAIGLAISFIEEALREAWLTIVWGPKETTSISLGQKPVVFGSSREADVYLSPRQGQAEIPPVRALVGIEGGRVILDDRVTRTRRELRNGETADLGRVNIVANIKTGN
jgi:Ca-activated chloride channel family protein